MEGHISIPFALRCLGSGGAISTGLRAIMPRIVLLLGGQISSPIRQGDLSRGAVPDRRHQACVCIMWVRGIQFR